jgi:glutaredoxin
MKQEYKIEIYSKDNCGYCDAAKRLLEDAGYLYTEYKLGGEDNLTLMEKLADRMQQSPRTVPQIFINDSYIGGFTQLKLYLKGMQPNDSWGAI